MIDHIKYYRIKRKIGSGGMATVYEAIDTRYQRRVALKVLHPHLADQPTYVARFLREAQMATALHSPYIVRVLEFGEDKGLHYLAMEYVSGITLQQFVQQHGALSVAQALDVAYQIAQALDEASQHGIVHRDIKPQNIMIMPNGAIKVMDFGIARAVLMDSMTMTGMFVGTPHYSSPEQAGGDPVDSRSDLYSLGVVLYQLLTGTVPFQADTPQALLLRVMQGNPVSVRSLRVDLPLPVADTVDRMLQRDPARRFQSPAELCNALRPLLGAQPGGTQTEMATLVAPLVPRTPAPSRREVRRSSALYWGVGALLTLVVLALGLLIWKPWVNQSAVPITPTLVVAQVTAAGMSAGLPTPATPTPLPTARPTATEPPASAPTAVATTVTTTPSNTPSAPTATATETATNTRPVPTITATTRPTSASATPSPPATSETRTPASKTSTPAAPSVKLAAPELLRPPDGETQTGSVTFRWSAVTGAAGYRVETRSDRADQTDWRLWQAGKTTELRIVFDDHPDYFKIPGTVYQWRVAALDATGQVGVVSGVRGIVFQRPEKPAPTAPPTAVPPTAVPPTTAPPTAMPPTAVPPPTEPPTAIPPPTEPPGSPGLIDPRGATATRVPFGCIIGFAGITAVLLRRWPWRTD